MLTFLRTLLMRLHLKRDPVGYARWLGVTVGDDCRLLGTTLGTFGSEPYLVTLGNHVTITVGVRFSTHDGGVWVFREKYPDIDVVAPITIGNNVFVGMNALILPGVTIGDDCVIGAGAVVNRDIPSGSVAAGVPARVIRPTSEYWERIKDRAFHVRSLPVAQKKQRFLEAFGRTGGPARP